MTYCPLLLEKVDKDLEKELKKLDAGERIDLEAFGEKICGEDILHPDKKVKALIKIAKGEEWWAKKENRDKIVDVKKDGSKGKKGSGKKIPLPKPEDEDEITDSEKEELSEILQKYKKKNEDEEFDSGSKWDFVILKCVKYIDIPKTALEIVEQHRKSIKTLKECLDNMDMTRKLVELHEIYPSTLQDTIKEMVEDMKKEKLSEKKPTKKEKGKIKPKR